MTDSDSWPTEIKVKTEAKILQITFKNGVSYSLGAELLRVESPSAEVQGHGKDQKQLVSGRRHVGFLEIEPVGNYAIRIRFDDTHDTGIYSWEYLQHLGRNKEEIWDTYLANIAKAGLSRDP